MSIWRLIIREVGHRKLNFALASLSILVAVACLVSMLTILRGYDLRTEEMLAAKQQEVEERGKKLKDDYRKITKGLGFNILILPQGQNLGDIYADGYASKYMPEDYVTRLAESEAMTVNHLLPTLEQKITWPEQKRTILLVGTRGEVPFVNRKMKKPLLDPVAPGEIVFGYELANQLGLAKGDEITLLGDKFTVANTYKQRGNKDDITAWVSLKKAQELLDKEGQINAIWALECNCETVERLAEIRDEIAAILPQTQVIEMYTKATARAEARNRAVEEAVASLQSAKSSRQQMRDWLESMTALVIPVVMIACGLWVGLLALGNVRDRRPEIGILRAIGLRGSQILSIFLGKAATAGFLGGLAGLLAGIAIGAVWFNSPSAQVSVGGESNSIDELLNTGFLTTLAVVYVATPLLAAMASWLPAMLAAQQDPAEILCEE